ncbi:carboxylesterase family protein [Sphingomonas piscis]|uniref:Carboxylic ester hydrolase n=1 Tax=Sphingomonas piscis TaxID=2714943 RepID=A0A6G7YMM7_9SPHN|nr:carboxylesterase family protein [Sphingomonas piscis]QIK77992.1 carboxylesterase family protein [Sphingomonas piscis]
MADHLPQSLNWHKLSGALALALISLTSSASALASTTSAKLDAGLVKTEQGLLQGIVDGDLVHFRGIRYAAPPVGALRFAPPQLPARWRGVRAANTFGPICPQGKEFNEDCLFLNVSAPKALKQGTRLPVMVWLHGGGLSVGTPNTYDASRLVRQGHVVFVGVEFRVNAFGFFGIKGLPGSGTFGFQDQQAALRWVKQNISAFGGDPNNVTLFGESGGGVSTCAQVVSPKARNLFQRAIIQSGTCSISWPKHAVGIDLPAGSFFQPLSETEALGVAAAARLGCGDGSDAARIACLRKLPSEKIASEGGTFTFAAFNTPTLPLDPQAALASGKYHRVPIMIGFTRDESRAMASGALLTGKPITDQNYTRLIGEAFGPKAGSVLSRYPLQRFGDGASAWSAANTDRMFACPALYDALNLSSHNRTFVYEFADPNGIGLVPFLPTMKSGASHSSELPLLFDLADGPIDLTNGKKIARSPVQEALAKTMIGYWTDFARSGDPNSSRKPTWPPFRRSGSRKVLVLAPGSDRLRTTDAYSSHRCDFWEEMIVR